jgi:nucleotide-binding universal stress UspA family protein
MTKHPGYPQAIVATDFSPAAKAAVQQAIGTVGRSGVKGMLLGNTAEKVLDTCDCSMLTVKPDGFVSPIE